MAELFEAMSQWGVAAFIRQSAIAYPLVNAAHIFSLALLVGAIVTLDLRLLGAFRAQPLSALAPPLSRVAAIGLGCAAVTGFLLFSTRPAAYAANPAFLVKLALVTLGALNALTLRFSPAWRDCLWGAPPGIRLRIAAAVSLALWSGAVLAGRWVGFLQ